MRCYTSWNYVFLIDIIIHLKKENVDFVIISNDFESLNDLKRNKLNAGLTDHQKQK